MTLARLAWVGFGMAISIGLASGCGGAVSEKTSARDDLASTGTSRCRDACNAMASCLPQVSCDCTCGCAAGDVNCTCPPCDCGPPATVDGCVAGCQDTVDSVLKANGGCEDEVLAELSCVASAGCHSEAECKVQEQALEDCQRRNERPPAAGGTVGSLADAGSSSSSSSGVSCRTGSGGGASEPVAPGQVQCESGWGSCTDGHRYRVTCTAYERVPLECVCFVDDAPGATFDPAVCPTALADVKGPCGWNFF